MSILVIKLGSCKPSQNPSDIINEQETNTITCNDNSCYGTYSGPEFINGDDVAHQFSNHMSTAVGNQLKKLYHNKKFSKVEFSRIEMTTTGMGTGTVSYYLKIPFTKVTDSCEAFTSFDHCGGWNHAPALERRKRELQNVTLAHHDLFISDLKTTPQGLQEYWIQWKNKKVQTKCE